MPVHYYLFRPPSFQNPRRESVPEVPSGPSPPPPWHHTLHPHVFCNHIYKSLEFVDRTKVENVEMLLT